MNITQEKYYYCSKYIKFPLKKVVLEIYELFNTRNKNLINLSDIYDHLRLSFNVKSFNRANLVKLLNSQTKVSFNAVKDLYVKYVIEDIKETETDYDILKKVLINNRLLMIELINKLTIDSIKYILSNGVIQFVKFFNALKQIENPSENITLSDKNRLIYNFINQYDEQEFIIILKDENLLIEKIKEFEEKDKVKNKLIQFKNEIDFRLKYVHSDNLNLKAKYLFVGSLPQILLNNKIKIVSDFQHLSYSTIQELIEYSGNVLHKLKLLQFSLKQKYSEDFKLLLQQANKQNKPNRLWENYVSVLENRAKGKTLEVSGKHLGITRERTRQLENKYFKDFVEFNLKMNTPINRLRAMVENEFFVTDSDIKNLFPVHPLLFKYLLLNCNNDNLEYSEELGKFYFIDDYRWYDDAIRYAEELPNQINESDLNKYSTALYSKLIINKIEISEEDCEKIIISFYRKAGDVFSKNKMNLTEKYKHIWKEFFPESVNIYDEEFLMHFKKAYSKTFGDYNEYSNRSIISILTRIGMLCGRGKYRINDRMFMSEELANKIYNYIINSGHQTFLTSSLFSIFGEDLIKEGIDNRYFLQGALKQRVDDKLYFRRDYISTTAGDFNIYSDILNYVKESQKILAYDEIKNYFQGVTDIVLWLALAQDGILWYRKKFIHIDNLHITEEEKFYLKDIMDQLLSDNQIHHASQLMQYIKLTNNKLLQKYFVTEQFALFSIVQNLFDGEFEFKRPFIANKGIVIGNQLERIKEYVYSKDCCLIDDLLEFIYENQMHIYSILECVNSLTEYVFKDETCLISEESAKINKYNVATVEKIIEKEIGNEDFVFTEQLKCFRYFPTEVKWTDWLLYSSLNRYGTVYNVITSNNIFKIKNNMLAKPIIVRKNLNIHDVEELKKHLKNVSKLNNEEFFIYLKSKGLA